MKNHCRFTFNSKLSKICAVTIYPLLSLFTGVLCIYSLINMFLNYMVFEGYAFSFILSGSISGGLIYLSIICYTFENRKFTITEEGIFLNDKNRKCYKWDEISEIALMCFAASSSLQNYQTVICCILYPPPENFLRKILRSYIYGVKNQKKFIIIDYSTSIFDDFLSFSHRNILDYRDIQLNKF